MKKNIRFMVATVAIVLAVLLGLFGLSRFRDTKVQNEVKENVTVVSVVPVQEYSSGHNTVRTVGELESSAQAELRSQVSGPVTRVNVRIGDQVNAGQILVEVQNNDLVAQVNQARASVAIQQAKLDELNVGTREVDLDISKLKVDNAKKTVVDSNLSLDDTRTKASVTLQNLYDEIPDILQDAYLQADDAVRKQTDDMFDNDNSTFLVKLTFSTSNQGGENETKRLRVDSENTLLTWNQELTEISSDKTMLDASLNTSLVHLEIVRSFLGELAGLVGNSLSLSETTISTYRTSVNTGRTNVNTAIKKINDQKQLIAAQKITNQKDIAAAQATLNTSKNSLALAESDLLSKEDGATPEAKAAQEGQVAQARANLQSIQAKLGKTIIRSPIKGSVVTAPVRVGEFVGVGNLVASIVDTDAFQVKAYVSNIDVNKINVGSLVSIEGGVDGVVTRIAPGIDPTKQKIELLIAITSPEQTRLIAGQYLNVEITGDTSDTNQNTYLLPLRAIKITNNTAFAYTVDENSVVQKHAVAIGSILNDKIEILEGLSQDMAVITSIRGVASGQVVKIKEE